MKRVKSILVLIIAVNFLGFIVPTLIFGQSQTFTFSGNNPDSYQCIDPNSGAEDKSTKPEYDDASGYYMCRKGLADAYRAIFKPPTLAVLQDWFKKILYYIWLLVGGYSFLMLVYLGYQYMLRGGTNDQELVNLRKRIINYIIGFSLVFLAIPILRTVFNVIGIRKDVDCYDVAMPGFQFFFPTLCTDPRGEAFAQCNDLTNSNVAPGSLTGIACTTNNATQICSKSTRSYYFICRGNVWELSKITNE